LKIIKTNDYHPLECKINAIVGDEKENMFDDGEEIEVSQDELELLENKNPSWFIIVGD